MNWDEYFFKVCNTISENSKCLSRKIGAILVRNKSIICTGYNGPPRGVPHCDFSRYIKDAYLFPKIKGADIGKLGEVCPRAIMGFKSGEGLDFCPAGHAERNVLVTAARSGINTNHCTMYMNCAIPCKDCLIEIINAGIKEIVVTKYEFYDRLSPYLLHNSELKWRVLKIDQYFLPQNTDPMLC